MSVITMMRGRATYGSGWDAAAGGAPAAATS
jgi:hypothetical protein